MAFPSLTVGLILIAVDLFLRSVSAQSCESPANMALSNTFLYFAYGSNLLAKRIHINSPSAVRYATGKLKNFRLDFNRWSKGWGGCSATIVPDESQHVWGAVWEIDSSNLKDLDRQEGVATGWYIPIEVTVESPCGEEIVCRCYQMTDILPALEEGEVLPVPRRPSPIYRECIIQGAYESGLPQEYLSKLKEIPHNGYNGTIQVNIDIPIKN